MTAARLERLCNYLLRPPFSRDSVHRLPDGRVRLDLPREARSIEMTAAQFIAKLVALVPLTLAIVVLLLYWNTRSIIETGIVLLAPPRPSPPGQLALLPLSAATATRFPARTSPAAPWLQNGATSTARAPTPHRDRKDSL